jgi:thioredoxin reductase (NADPH)
MTGSTHRDVLIVGGGPCGLAAAIACQRHGWTTVTFDKGSLVSSIESYPTYINFFSTAAKIAIGGVPFVCTAEKPSRRDALAYYRMVVQHTGIDVRTHHAVQAVQRTAHGFTVAVGHDDIRTEWTARAVVIATGYFGSPNRLGVPGEELPHVTHYYRDGHEAFGRDALVVGGGNSAVEAALDLYRCGARVRVVHFGPTFDKNIKPWVRPDFEARVAEGAIQLQWETRVESLAPGRAALRTAAGVQSVAADHVYLMTGYTPDPLLLSALGVAVDPSTGVPAHDPATMETPVAGVFLAGVLASGFDANKIFIENGRDHGDLIAAALDQRLAFAEEM